MSALPSLTRPMALHSLALEPRDTGSLPGDSSGEGEGLTAPADDAPAEVTQILAEMRQLRTDLVRTSEKLGRLEKRLRELQR